MSVKPITPDDYHYGAVEALAKRLFAGEHPDLIWDCVEITLRRPWLRFAKEGIRALEAAGYKVVGPAVTETQWGGLARAIVMWCHMPAPHTPNSLLMHLERTGETVPEWLLAEPEMANRNHAMSKGTIAVIIWKAMLETAPTLTEQKP